MIPILNYCPKQNLAFSQEHELTTDIDGLLENQPSSFTLIYCMEVCEHLTDRSLDELLQNITSLASSRARIIIGVPIETGLSGFLKSIYRTAHGGRQSASIAQAFRALFGMKIERRGYRCRMVRCAYRFQPHKIA